MKKLSIILFLSCLPFQLIDLNAQSIHDFSLENLEGEWLSFDELKGEQLTIIDFWASWCKPCMKAMPAIDQLHQKYKDKGLNVISINTDGPRSISKVLPISSTLKLSYPVLSDIDNVVMQDLNITVLPTLLIIDTNGEVVYRHEGWVTGNEIELENQIKSILQ
ncbi:TlpA disulfide reductase family protein [Carboxylicivirga sp. M1479]|uniref:TlpA family protein disulfide reductase n=1 Tax=Carboxylicivirga sp. M1479 TaxID=2594476 RepID=UPI001178917B|nr:TlpA disulfide reductase family protein [Carboxylicivirga sp. M1479]TRX66154.1 TlpA family protein disulfide reductase [Carboxylicivirga sp. M1479]